MVAGEEDFVGVACRPAIVVEPETIPLMVVICHPWYEPENDDNVMLRLDAYTRDGGGRSWFPRQLVQDIFMGLTGYVKDGFINCSRKPGAAIVTQTYLQAGKRYYFHLGLNEGEESECYPVVPFFRHLPFKPEYVGAHWRAAVRNLETAIHFMHGECMMSGRRSGVEYCHMVPEGDEEVWYRWSLGQCATQVGSRATGRVTSNPSNMVYLDRALHRALDHDKSYFFAPVEAQLVPVFFGRTIRLAMEFHARALRGGLEGKAPECFYLRMMVNIFEKFYEDFLKKGPARLLRYRDGTVVSKSSIDMEFEHHVETRSTSSRKRRSPDASPDKSSPQPPVSGVQAVFGMKRKRVEDEALSISDSDSEADRDSAIYIEEREHEAALKRRRLQGRGRARTRSEERERKNWRSEIQQRQREGEKKKKELNRRLLGKEMINIGSGIEG